MIEGDDACSLSSFMRYIPASVIQPKREDWGTCLCKMCTNPQLKLDALLAANILDEKNLVEDVVQDQMTHTALITTVENSAKEN